MKTGSPSFRLQNKPSSTKMYGKKVTPITQYRPGVFVIVPFCYECSEAANVRQTIVSDASLGGYVPLIRNKFAKVWPEWGRTEQQWNLAKRPYESCVYLGEGGGSLLAALLGGRVKGKSRSAAHTMNSSHLHLHLRQTLYRISIWNGAHHGTEGKYDPLERDMFACNG